MEEFQQDLAIATSDKTCDGSIHKPDSEHINDYPEICVSCKRFYMDLYEGKDIK